MYGALPGTELDLIILLTIYYVLFLIIVLWIIIVLFAGCSDKEYVWCRLMSEGLMCLVG